MININKKKIERPGREIKIDNTYLNNNNVTVKIGTTDNKNHPETVYISLSFWVDIKNKDKLSDSIYNFDRYISKLYIKEIKSLMPKYLENILKTNNYFPYYSDNILTFDFPENLNYNNKKSFTNIELTLHTLNPSLPLSQKLPFKTKNNSEIFNELLSISKIICNSELLSGNLDFKISKTKK